jgi:hypothetical protein
VVVNVIDGDFSINYPYMVYNSSSESSNYLIANSNGSSIAKQSFANIIYRNIRTFSGFIARHKVYKKSLFSPGDFEVVADEPLSSYELIRDNLTTNKTFDLMGSFYNQTHVGRYWFVNGNKLSLFQKLEEGVYLYNNFSVSFKDQIFCNGLFEIRNKMIVELERVMYILIK